MTIHKSAFHTNRRMSFGFGLDVRPSAIQARRLPAGNTGLDYV